MTNKQTDFIASFAKGLQVIECFGAETPRLSITDVSLATGFDRATARRCLLTLHHEGYADYDGKFFTLTHRALRLGMSALTSLTLPQTVQPWLDQLSQQIGQSCSVAVLDEGEVVYVARAAERRIMSIGLMPGSRLPAHCTSMGRVLLAALPEDQARAVIEAADLSPRTPMSLTSPNDIAQAVSAARRDGYAMVDQEVELGLRSIAVPLFDSRGQTVAALNTGMAATQVQSEDIVVAFLPKLKRVQSGLQRIL